MTMHGSIRQDPVSHRWVIIAPEKANAFIQISSELSTKRWSEPARCPFCPGHEFAAEKEIMRLNSLPHLYRGWSLRVFPARNPLLKIEAEQHFAGDGIYDIMHRLGAHEVVVETPRHGIHLDELSVEEIRDIIRAWHDRFADLQGDRRFKYISIQKNRGDAAGGTVNHHYSEILAMPFVPSAVETRLKNATAYYQFKRRCVICDVITQELAVRDRIIEENDDFVAFCPYASRFPFESWIAPKRHMLYYSEMPYELYLPFAKIYRSVTLRIRKALNAPAWNMVIHSGPVNYDDFTHNPYHFYHWHMELFPRISTLSALPLAVGAYVNPTPPEEAAAFLRKMT